MRGVDRTSFRVPAQRVAELLEQLLELGAAAVNVADDIERAVILAPVVVLLLVPDRRRVDAGDTVQDVDLAETLPGQPAQPTAQVCPLAPDDAGVHVAVRARRVALDRQALRHVEHDRDWQDVVVAGELDQLGTVLPLDVGGVDDGEPPGTQPGRGDVVQDV